jgi:hypothetical protein
MKRKATYLVCGIFLGLLAVPALAQGGEPEQDFKAFPVTFTGTSGHTQFNIAGGGSYTCTSDHVSGTKSNKTTKTIKVKLTGCVSTEFFGASCNSPGQASGIVETGVMVAHNVYLTDSKTTPGILLTPPTGGVFAEFTCGFVTVKITGNGLIGHISSPKCGETSKTMTLGFGATGPSQTFKQATATGTSFHLQASVNGGSSVEAAFVSTENLTYAESGTLTCV